MFHVEHIIQYEKFAGFDATQNLFEEYSDQIREYVDQLIWWNERVNLISRDVSRETIVEHVRHSLVVNSSKLINQCDRVIDAGTGGGLPGIPLAIVRDDIKVLLNDVVSKKVMACKQMVIKLGLNNCRTMGGSIADIDISEADCIVSKHAFKINDLITMIGEKPWLGIILLKGVGEIKEELEGVGMPLNIRVLSLQNNDNPFYTGKAMVEITKQSL